MIRAYQLSDREQLIDLFKLNTPTYFDPDEQCEFEKYLDRHGDTYLTIVHKNQIVGGAGYRITDGNTVGRITWIFFHPDSAGHGLGRQAVEHCMTIFRLTSSIEKVVVTTSQFAYRFFEKFGMQLTETAQDHWGPGLDLYRMEMILA